MRVSVLGACAVDHYVILNSFPDRDTLVFAEDDFHVPGGGGLNVSVNLAVKDVRVSLHTSLGDDGFGDAVASFLKDIGVNLKARRFGRTARTVVLIEPGGSRRIVSLGGDALINSLEEVDLDIESDALIVLEAYPSVAYEFFRSSAKLKVYAPGGCGLHFGADEIRKVASLADITFLSETEASAIPDFENLSDLVIVTRGKDSTVLFSKGKLLEEVHVREVREVMDTTGAGDACLSGIVYGMLKGLDVEASVELGHKWAEEVIKILCPNFCCFKWDAECTLVSTTHPKRFNTNRGCFKKR